MRDEEMKIQTDLFPDRQWKREKEGDREFKRGERERERKGERERGRERKRERETEREKEGMGGGGEKEGGGDIERGGYNFQEY